MIKSIELFNFESHKHSFLEFDKGLNIFKGSSGSGKSSIKRGLIWVLTNRPSANQVVSWWAYNQKGKQVEETKVLITLDDGTTIARIKSDTLNGYQINDNMPLEAVGTSVPEEVSKLLNMSDISYQSQLAAPFLISQSASYVAQYINDIVDMSESDRYQASVESKRRKCNADLDSAITSIKNTTEALKDFDWLEEAEKRVKRIERVETEYEKLLADYKTIDDLAIGEYREQVKKQESCDVIPEAEDKVDSVTTRLEELKKQKCTKQTIFDSFMRICDYQKDDIENATIFMAEKLEKRISRMLLEQTVLQQDVDLLNGLLQRFSVQNGNLRGITSELDAAEREFNLIEICPYCFSKIENHKCEF